MKDIIITGKRRKKEILILVSCFAIAFLINVLAIIIYKTPWYEIFTQMGYVLAIALVLFLTVTLFRILVWGVKRLLKKRS
jgi:F0F1-type ATP synthase membrane subunit a